MNDLKSTHPQGERASFCEYLREQREDKSLSLEGIARTTKIPERSLACLERGEFEKLPADVFVRGFLRSYANCVGLDADEIVRRYAACGLEPGPVATPEAGALVDPNVAPSLQARGEARAAHPEALAPTAEPEAAAEPEQICEKTDDESAKAKTKVAAPRRERGKRRRKSRRRGRARPQQSVRGADRAAGTEADSNTAHAAAAVPPAPVLVIDDDDPGVAEQQQAKRAKGEERERDFSRRMFLPPVLLDPDQGSRRGALTVGVIILVIVATITMSYLLRRPSSNTDGLTDLRPTPSITAASHGELIEA